MGICKYKRRPEFKTPGGVYNIQLNHASNAGRNNQSRVLDVENASPAVGLILLSTTPATMAMAAAVMLPNQKDLQASLISISRPYQVRITIRVQLFSRLMVIFNTTAALKFSNPQAMMFTRPIQVHMTGSHCVDSPFHTD